VSKTKKIAYEAGSGNVFVDLGFPNAGEHLVKTQLVHKIDTIMKKRRLKQVEAARLDWLVSRAQSVKSLPYDL
jgi:predicted XRE-type DNA-binding protein